MASTIKQETLNIPIKPEALLSQVVITVSPQVYAKFLAKLDALPQPNERLRKTMQTQTLWDKQ